MAFFCACGLRVPDFCKQTPDRYEYRHNATMAYPLESFVVKISGDGTPVIKYSHGGPDAEVYKAPEGVLERIRDMVLESKLYKLKRHYSPKVTVLDGYSWSIFISYTDDYIHSGGSNARPDASLSAGIKNINDYLRDYIKSSGEEAIISIEPLDP